MGMPELALYHEQRDTLAGHLDGVSVTQLVVVPTSAQASLCRPARYADLGEKVCARWDDRRIDVGITRVPWEDCRSVQWQVREGDSGGSVALSVETPMAEASGIFLHCASSRSWGEIAARTDDRRARAVTTALLT